MLAAIGLHAQPLGPGTRWFDGRNMFVASEGSGKITLTSADDGGRTKYVLNPIPDQQDWFTLDGENTNSVILSQVTLASLTEDEGRKMLVIYRGGLVDKLFERTALSSEEIIAERWYPTVRGKYTLKTPDGRTRSVLVNDNLVTIDGETVSYKIVTSNGAPLDVVDIQDGVGKGAWHFVRTIDGFNVYRSKLNDSGEYEELYDEVDDRPYVLSWADPTQSRWSYLSEVFIIPIHYTKESLRLIRNHILAQHGYVFRDKQLKEYFKTQPWYKPGKDNDSINLNFIEQMNISRIQGEEAKADEERNRVTEEVPGIKNVAN
jgi:hypothetical protein